MIIITLLSVSIILFEVSFREITIFEDLSLMFIIINLFYWLKRYDVAIWVGVISSLLIDLILQNKFGQTQLCVFLPLFILTFFDNLLKLESRLSRLVFSSVSAASTIFMSDFLLKLFFFNGEFNMNVVIRRIIISVIILILLNILFGKIIFKEEKGSKYS